VQIETEGSAVIENMTGRKEERPAGLSQIAIILGRKSITASCAFLLTASWAGRHGCTRF